MSLPYCLVSLRKERGLIQQQMADLLGIHVSQLKRYEAGKSEPTLEVFRRIALAFRVSADLLLFEEYERGPDENLKSLFEAVSKLDPKEREAIKIVIASVLYVHDAKRWTHVSETLPAPNTKPRGD